MQSYRIKVQRLHSLSLENAAIKVRHFIFKSRRFSYRPIGATVILINNRADDQINLLQMRYYCRVPFGHRNLPLLSPMKPYQLT